MVAAFKGGSPDVEASRTRVDRFAAELKDKWGVEFVDSIEALCEKVDAVLLESVDGRPHLAQVRPVFKAKKRVFVDKPFTASYADAREIARLSRESGVPFFSSSSLRFAADIQAMRNSDTHGGIQGAFTFGPENLEPHHPDLFWYGIHAVEMLYTLLGPGCEQVTRVKTDSGDTVVGRWKDGRIGTMRGLIQGRQEYGAIAFGMKAVLATPVPMKTRLSRPARRDREVLPDRRAARDAGRDTGDHRVHGSRRAEQGPRRRARFDGRRHAREMNR